MTELGLHCFTSLSTFQISDMLNPQFFWLLLKKTLSEQFLTLSLCYIHDFTFPNASISSHLNCYLIRRDSNKAKPFSPFKGGSSHFYLLSLQGECQIECSFIFSAVP